MSIGTSGSANSGAMAASSVVDICVPSTVIFEHNFPKAWYYPSAGGADIERKLGRDVDAASIVHEFSKSSVLGSAKHAVPMDTASGDVVATYYSTVDIDGKSATRVEFLDAAGLNDLIMRRTRRPDGFLQKWVSCPGKRNTVVQALWSPHLCIVSKRQNRLPIRDTRQPLFDRCVTYEGHTHQSDEVFVAPHIRWQVQNICGQVVTFLAKTYRIAVKRMVLHFKVDCNSTTWLLYCGSMRFGEHTQLNLAPLYVRHALHEEAEEEVAAQQIVRTLRDGAYESPRRRRSGANVGANSPAVLGSAAASSSDWVARALLQTKPQPP